MLPLEEVVRDAESFHAIIDDHLYLGNLSAAESPQLMERLGVTHILSVCPDYLATAAHIEHCTIPMADDEHFDILEHLPTTCQFIQEALDEGGRVFVHCVMGISRSAAVVSAYRTPLHFAVMFSRHISAAQAIQFVRKRETHILILKLLCGYGAVRTATKQTKFFSECNFDVSPAAPPYIQWKKLQEFDTAHSIRAVDGVPITDRLFLSSDFPSNKSNARAWLEHLGITHVVTITPDQISQIGDILMLEQVHKHFIAPYTAKESLLIALPTLCQFVAAALQGDQSRVLVHCLDEMRGGIAICACLMLSRQIRTSEALEILQDHVPLFDDDPVVRRHLELFEECNYEPSHRHPLVRSWLSRTPPPNSVLGLLQLKASSYVDAIIQKGISMQASVASLHSGPVEA
ncbi:protein-tyrosine phosphatase-like protein [Mycena pura]|uniref:protein-tyrosine-phosphatase n=1 Tax=Mycena pura TaxID=153505 RepID=A0AAD6YVH9_9AGAR|nr:protein-tyrosine phosphatase-like protein [Mycena pura]